MTASITEMQDRGARIEERGNTTAPHQTRSPIPDPRSSILLNTTAEDHHIARMAAVALGLTVLENAIPSPLPGVKPGLANIVTLIVLARYGWGAAAGGLPLWVGAGRLPLRQF